jgi:DNA-binding response OmpR family regulator
MIKKRILIVDDDIPVARLLAELLADEGFETAHARTGAAVLTQFALHCFDLAILKAGTDRMEWIKLLRRLRVQWHLPVLMLTASGGEEEGILGLELGAEDYLVKPFRARELVARLRAVLRRSERNQKETSRLKVGELAIDSVAKSATMGGVVVRLTTAEFLLLEALARSAGRVQSRAALTYQALGRRLQPFDRSIDTHVSNIRRKLSLDERRGIEILSFRGRGYVLTVPRGMRREASF